MDKDMLTEERIDNYILGRMDHAERVQFESDLQSDSVLREEYEAQKEIANAVQRLAMREFLADCERARSSKTKLKFIGIRQTINGFVVKLREIASSGHRLAWGLSAMAAMVVAVIGISNYSTMSESMQSSAFLAYSQTFEPRNAKGADELDDLLASAYASIGSDQLDLAETQLSQAYVIINEELAAKYLTEEGEYNRLMLQFKRQDADWYSALVLMKRGKVFKARKALARIAAEGGEYSQEAQKLIEEVFCSK